MKLFCVWLFVKTFLLLLSVFGLVMCSRETYHSLCFFFYLQYPNKYNFTENLCWPFYKFYFVESIFKSCVFFFMLSMLNFSKKLFAQFLLEKNGPFWKNDGVKIEIFKILTILLGLFYYNWNNVLFNNILSIGNFWYIHLTCNHSLSTMSKNRKYFNWIVPTCLHEIFKNLI